MSLTYGEISRNSLLKIGVIDEYQAVSAVQVEDGIRLLNEMLRAVGLERGDVYIANILKCRPPNNRDPEPGEVAACSDYLDRQISLIEPDLILAVGRIAAQNLLQLDQPVGRLRGVVHRYGSFDIPLVVTYHPAYLLRSPSQKRKAWADLCLARSVTEHPES